MSEQREMTHEWMRDWRRDWTWVLKKRHRITRKTSPVDGAFRSGVVEILDDLAALRIADDGIATRALDDLTRAIAHADAREPVGDAAGLGDVVGDDDDRVPSL